MELKDFVSQTINQIIDGVLASQAYAAQKGAKVNPRLEIDYRNKVGLKIDFETAQPIEEIEFDVAVSASEGTATQGGVSVLVGVFGLGTKGESERNRETVNRIRFSIPVTFPRMERQ